MIAAATLVAAALGFNMPAPDAMVTRRQAIAFSAAAGAALPGTAFARNNFKTSEAARAEPTASVEAKRLLELQDKDQSQNKEPNTAKPAPIDESPQDAELRRLGLKPVSNVDQCFTTSGKAYNCRP